MQTPVNMTVPQMRVATVEQAVGWISGGWNLFKKSPGVWIAILVIYMIIGIVAHFIPLVGSLAMALFTPVLTVGGLLGCKELSAGGELKLSHLFAGFQSQQMGNLVVLGLLTLVATAALVLIAGLGGMGMVVGSGLTEEAISSGQFGMESLGLGALIFALFILLLVLLMSAAFIFAVPLVGLGNVQPVAAIKLSIRACISNWLSMLVWSLIALVLLMLGAIPFGLGLLVVFPMTFAGYYLMYRDIFATGA